MTPAEDLDRLLSAAADGELSAADQLHLAVLLRDDPAARAAYLEYMLLDALLRWEKPQPVPAAPVEPARPRRTLRRAGWVLVACLLVGAGVGLFFIGPTQEVAAKSDVLDRLADWNVAIADAPTPADRRERYRERAETLGGELTRAGLPAHERKLADALFENARALADADTPLAVAERLDATSEQIQEWMWAHPDADPKRAQAMERHYLRFAERSLGNLRKAEAAEVPDAVKAKRVERVTERIARRAEVRAAKEAERAEKKAGR